MILKHKDLTQRECIALPPQYGAVQGFQLKAPAPH